MRLGSLLASAVGIVAAFAVWLGLSEMLPVSANAAMPERIGLACAALLPAIGVIDLMVVVQMVLRAWCGAIDPLAGRDGRMLQVNQRALTNTVEQLAAFAPALVALAAGAPPAWMRFVVAAGLTFGLARLVFWAGYLLGPLLRAPGMAASFVVNVATVLAAGFVWLR
jgi:MAPEG family protein